MGQTLRNACDGTADVEALVDGPFQAVVVQAIILQHLHRINVMFEGVAELESHASACTPPQ